MPTDRTETLIERGVRALKWNYIGTSTRALSQLLIGLLLARLLGPEAFGTTAIAWLMIGVGMLVADLGLGAALVQRDNVTPQDIRFLFTAQVLLGAAMSLAGVLVAEPVARFFHRPDATPIVRAMSLLFLVQSFGQTALAMLRRSLNFKASQTIALTSYVLGYAVLGLPAAYYGWGAWSLVAAQLAQSALLSILAIWSSEMPIGISFASPTGGLFRFGSKVIVANLASWGFSNIDSFAVGRLLGVTNLGVYNRAMALLASPTNAVTSGLQGVLFATCSRAQNDRPRLKRAYLAATVLVAGLCLPVFISCAVVPETLIMGLLGTAWAAAIPVVVPLSLAMPVYALLTLVGPILTAMNRVELELRAQAVTLFFMFPLLYIAARHSLRAVAWSMLAIYVLRCVLLIRVLLPALEATWRELVHALLWPVLAALAIASATWSSDQIVHAAPPLLRLLTDIGVATVAVAAMGRLVGRRLIAPLTASSSVRGMLPGPVRFWFNLS
jgi:O-antigen/teichoic acid export membrane protein